MYACTARTERGARCRTLLKSGVRCNRHGHQGAERAPKPHVVLLKFNINQKWKSKFVRLGVKVTDEQKDRSRHEAHARTFGRNPYRYRQVADSGVPVFGPPGLKSVSLDQLIQELVNTYKYETVDIHIKPRKDGMSVLVLSFSNDQPAVEPASPAALEELLRFLSSACWGYVHVWANPPQADGRVIHTVNSAHREESKGASLLHFADGLWSVEHVPKA